MTLQSMRARVQTAWREVAWDALLTVPHNVNPATLGGLPTTPEPGVLVRVFARNET